MVVNCKYAKHRKNCSCCSSSPSSSCSSSSGSNDDNNGDDDDDDDDDDDMIIIIIIIIHLTPLAHPNPLLVGVSVKTHFCTAVSTWPHFCTALSTWPHLCIALSTWPHFCIALSTWPHLPYFTDYKTLLTIRDTLIFKQFFKKITFLPFLLLDCKARLKKILSL
jgi:hypothetical protein